MRRAVRILAPLLALTSVAMLAADPAASEPREERLSYRFYVSGLKVGKANLFVTIDGDSYTAQVHAKSLGLTSWVQRVDAHANVSGRRISNGALSPELFEMESVTEKTERFTMQMPFAGDAPGDIAAEPPLREVHYAVDPKAQYGALDPLTAILTALLPTDATKPCDRSISIFDGRRRFDIVIDPPSRSYQDDGRPHVQCPARYHRVGGYKEKHMAAPDIPFSISFALSESGVAKPARIEGDTDIGTVVAILQN